MVVWTGKMEFTKKSSHVSEFVSRTVHDAQRPIEKLLYRLRLTLEAIQSR